MKLKHLLLLSCVTVANLYSAAAPDKMIVSHEDRKAFAAIVKIHAMAEEFRVGKGRDLTNPAMILEYKYCRINDRGITKTGLGITNNYDDPGQPMRSRFLCSPFGLIRLHAINDYMAPYFDERLGQLNYNYKPINVHERERNMGPRDSYYFRYSGDRGSGGNLYEILSVERKSLSRLEFLKDPDMSVIKLAQRKWFALTAAHSRESEVVAQWAEESKATLAKFKDPWSIYYDGPRTEAGHEC